MNKLEVIIKEQKVGGCLIDMRSKDMKSATKIEKAVTMQIVLILSEIIQQCKNVKMLEE